MDLEKVVAKIRPRRDWEAIDLGVSLVQQYAGVLYKIWFVITLPLFLLLTGIFYNSPEFVIFLVWFLKPIFERPLLYFLGRQLFGEGLTAKQCIKAFFSVAKIQWFLSLTFRRLSLTRSVDLAVIQLEGLKGSDRKKRLQVIHSGSSNSAVWLTTIFIHVELIIYGSIIALIFLMIPEVYLTDFNLWKWMTATNESNLESHILNLMMYFSISIVAPFYVACGFTLYLNQRTHLEAWDIELVFKRLATRLSERGGKIKVKLASLSSIGMLVMGVSFFSVQELKANTLESPNEIQKLPIETGKKKQNSPANKTSQEYEYPGLSHEKAKVLIKDITEGKDFHQIETQENYKYRPSVKSDDRSREDDDFSRISPGWLIFASIFSTLIEFALWIFIAVLALFLLLRYRHLLVRGISNKRAPKKRPKKLFGLDLDSQSLPDEPWLVAKDLIHKKHYRDALSLLYRASLIWYIDNSDAIIKEGYTELECLRQISQNTNSNSQQYMALLTKSWRELAYAHQTPAVIQLNQLCDDWPVMMNQAAEEKKASNNNLSEDLDDVNIQPKNGSADEQ